MSHFWEKRDIQQRIFFLAETDSVNLEVISLILMLHTRMDPVLNASLQLTTETLLEPTFEEAF